VPQIPQSPWTGQAPIDLANGSFGIEAIAHHALFLR
jgi:hypothetical protein